MDIGSPSQHNRALAVQNVVACMRVCAQILELTSDVSDDGCGVCTQILVLTSYLSDNQCRDK
jgi:hypothetical protein